MGRAPKDTSPEGNALMPARISDKRRATLWSSIALVALYLYIMGGLGGLIGWAVFG